ncbi:cellulase, partial [Chrysochromulina tobinii]
LPRRAIVQGQQLVDSASGAALQLHGLNIYLDYVHYDDMALMRQLLPSANLVRLVGIFWHDAERLADCTCCTDDITQGYFAPSCLEKLLTAVRAITSRGIWVVVAAKARYAAGEKPEVHPDVFHSAELARRFRELWRYVARALKPLPMLAGIEPMSEPRNKQVAQTEVARFYEGVCGAVYSVDDRMPCIVGPTPYYKVWQLNSSMLLHWPDGRLMEHIVYTFDFFEPWEYVTSEDGQQLSADGYPALYPCAVAHKGWASLFCPHGAEAPVMVDKQWLLGLLERFPLQLMRQYNVPVLANQWGVKRSVGEARGRLRYAEDVATLFEAHGVHSALWIWRSYSKDTWGFELVHEDEAQRETVDVKLMSTLDRVWRSTNG